MLNILVTGGAGYVGSHTCLALLEAGHRVVIVDDFSNAARDVPDRIAAISGAGRQSLSCYPQNICDADGLAGIFARQGIDAVIHLAARKSVPQSLAQPQDFFDENIRGLLTLLRVMEDHAVKRIVYSSSATVYGQPEALPIPEHAPLGYTNPYGLSKLVGEQFLNLRRRAGWSVGILRYFNPVGAHPSGQIAEAPRSCGGNLMPLLTRVALRELPQLEIFGANYGTPDGTGIRDYVHVCDIAHGHVLSLERLMRRGLAHTVNLGLGRGVSVLEVLRTFEGACGRRLPYVFRPRRPGDVPASFADVTMARQVLGFAPRFDLQDMCATAWRAANFLRTDLPQTVSGWPTPTYQMGADEASALRSGPFA